MKKTFLSILVAVLTLSLFFAIPASAATVEKEAIKINSMGAIRSDETTGGLDGYVGFEFTVQSDSITVTHLGRYIANGIKEGHEVQLYDVAAQKTIATVTVSSGKVASYSYVALSKPVKLTKGKAYYIASLEKLNGDGWLHNDTKFTADSAIKVGKPTYYFTSEKTWQQDEAPGTAYGIPGFKFTVEGEEAPDSNTTSGTSSSTDSAASDTSSVISESSTVLNSSAAPVSSLVSNGDNKSGGSNVGVIVAVVVVAIVVVAGVVVFIVKKKRQ